MSYGYSLDLRERVLRYIEQGHLQEEACKVFNVSRKTIYNWIREQRTTGDLSLHRAKSYQTTKFRAQDLKAYIALHEDAHLDEIAQAFKASKSGAYRALKRLNITRKKRPFYIKKEMKNNEENS